MWLRTTSVLVMLSFVIAIQGQQVDRADRNRYVEVPSDTILLMVASQPDCPLKIGEAKLFTAADGGGAWGASYTLHNAGTKPIKTLTVVLWTSFGTGGTLQRPTQLKTQLLPGQVIKGNDYDIVPLTEELRQKLNLKDPMRAVAVLIIEKIKFTDDSTYDAEATSQALLTYFQKLANFGDSMNRQKRY